MLARPSRFLVLCLLAGLAAAMQLAPVYRPLVGWVGAPYGPCVAYALALACTLPTAVAAAVAPRRCTLFFLVTGILIGMASVQEFYIYMMLTGPLGLMLGMTVPLRPWQSVGAAAAVLTGGLLLLPALAGVMPFGGAERVLTPLARLLAYAAFAVLYSMVWHRLFRAVWGRVAPSLPMRYTEEEQP